MSRRSQAGKQQLALFDVPSVARVAPAPVVEPVSVDEATRHAARELRGDLVLRAGAGTGKTHTLVEIATHAVAGVTPLGRVAVGNILALTFSEKAASELRARVRARFVALAAAPRADRPLEEAYRRAGVVPAGAEVWRAAALGVGAAPFTTFHGYAAALVRRHGGDPGFDILDEDEATALLRDRAEEAVLAALDEQPEAVGALVRELDFTRGGMARARGLVEHVIAVAERLREDGKSAADLAGDDPDAARGVLAQAATGHLAAMRDLITSLASGTTAGLKARREELTLLLPSVQATLAALDPAVDPFADGPLARVLEVCKGSMGNVEARATARRLLREAEDQLRSGLASLRAAPLAVTFAELVDRVLAAYAAGKRSLAVLDFADLVTRARAILDEDPAARAAEAARHRVVLVDELQDTNDLQDDLVQLSRGPEAPLVCVGDPKQSIYEFRGADVSVFDRVERRVVAAGGRALALTESRRSRAPLTAFVNRLFARALRGGEHPFEIAFDGERDALHAHRGGEGACVELLDGDDEPATVARRLRALIDGGAPVVHEPGRDGETGRPARWGDVAILLRRFTRLELFLEELRRARIPHYVVNGRGFFEAQEVRDLVHALVLIDEPEHQLATLTVLRSPLVGLSDPSLVALAVAAGGPLRLAPLVAPGFALPDALSPEERVRFGRYAALHRRLATHADRLGAAGVLRALVDETDLAAVLATTHHGEQRVANLERLLAVVADHDASGRGDRAALVRRLHAQAQRPRSLAAPAQIVGERDDVVRVMTVHQAKGLEFPVVFVPECGSPERDLASEVIYDRAAGLGFRLRTASQSERVPSLRAVRAEEVRRARARAESLRLFYVATTRARDLLVLSGNPTGSAPCWRREVDGLLESDETARSLVVRPPPSPPPGPLPPPPPPVAVVPGPPRTLPPTPTPARARLLVAPVTALAELAVCPRRYHLRHELGMVEVPLGQAGDELPEGGGAADRGSLAHSLLETMDLAAWPSRRQAVIDQALAVLPEAAPADVVDVRARITVLLDSPFGLTLTARRPGEDLRREVAFAYALDAPGPGNAGLRLLLKGQMDVVLDDGPQGLTILDYKLARSPADGRDHAYRLQLLAYAAAARALWGRPARVGLLYLRDRDPAPRFLPTPDVAEIDRELGALAAELAAARATGDFAKRPLPTCQALRCGYVSSCHQTTAAGHETP